MADDTREYEDFDRLSGAVHDGDGLHDAYSRAGEEIAESTGLGDDDPPEAKAVTERDEP
jgi:hypothetical protein